MLKNIIEKLIWLFILLLPLQTVFIFDEKTINGVKWQYGTGNFYLTEGLLILIVFLALIQLKKSENINLINFFTTQNLLKKATIICLWLFIAWSGLSLIWSIDKLTGFYLWIKLLEGIALFFIILTLEIDTNKILWPLTITTSWQGLLAVWQFITQSIISNKWLGLAVHQAGRLGEIVIENNSSRWLRAYGTFSHPNILGGFCSLGLLATLELLPLTPKKYQIILTLLAIANAWGVFFSFSRSAWLATIIILLIILLKSLSEKNYLIIKNLIVIFSVVFLLTIIFFNLIMVRGNFSNRLEQKSLNERQLQIKESFKIIKSSTILGIGINNYTAMLAFFNPQIPIYLLQPVHNIYLLILTELGWVGFILFIFFIFLLFIQTKNYYYKKIIWLTPLLLIALFDHYFWTQYSSIILFWLILTKIK